MKDSYRSATNNTNDEKLSEAGKTILRDRYLLDGEDYQGLFARVASAYADDREHADRLYGYMSNLWFMPATPILSNGGTSRGLPISCYVNESADSLEGIVDLWVENVWLASKGGGIGSYWGNLRSINEKVGYNGKTSGIVPFITVQDRLTLAISQGSLRRGSAAVYLPVSHPEIREFVLIRKPTGGDPNRKALNIHHGVVITDAFMQVVSGDGDWPLISPKSGAIISTIKARELWTDILTARIETGEPYILFIDNVNKHIPKHHKELGLKVKTSNLCSEITLPTGPDHLGNERTAVCCLSSMNLEYYDDWCDDQLFIEDIMRFLDNVLQDFIDNAPDKMSRAVYAASRERSIGLGVMGFHSLLQKKFVPFDSSLAKGWNNKIFSKLKTVVDEISVKLAHEKGPCPDAADRDVMERFSNKLAIAPTASISIIAGNASPGIEAYVANSFNQKTLTGSFIIKNKYLQKLLASKNMDNDQVWTSITTNEGSVQHLNFLSPEEKEVFKTAGEIDQRWVIDLAADRTTYICQGQSVNLFLHANVSKRVLHQIHFEAWKKGVKSLYYCRSHSMQRADKVSHKAVTIEVENTDKFEECLACQ
jgi:ribonucleoside-diphosphate reductase alpha chain